MDGQNNHNLNQNIKNQKEPLLVTVINYIDHHQLYNQNHK